MSAELWMTEFLARTRHLFPEVLRPAFLTDTRSILKWVTSGPPVMGITPETPLPLMPVWLTPRHLESSRYKTEKK